MRSDLRKADIAAKTLYRLNRHVKHKITAAQFIERLFDQFGKINGLHLELVKNEQGETIVLCGNRKSAPLDWNDKALMSDNDRLLDYIAEALFAVHFDESAKTVVIKNDGCISDFVRQEIAKGASITRHKLVL